MTRQKPERQCSRFHWFEMGPFSPWKEMSCFSSEDRRSNLLIDRQFAENEGAEAHKEPSVWTTIHHQRAGIQYHTTATQLGRDTAYHSVWTSAPAVFAGHLDLP